MNEESTKLHRKKIVRWAGLFLSLILCVFFASVQVTDAAVLSRPSNNLGLVGYWSFEDGAGSIATDFSGNGNHGTLTNMEAGDWVVGKRGRALQFDGASTGGGSNEYVALPDLSQSEDRIFTYSAWAKKVPGASGGYIFSESRASATHSHGGIIMTSGVARALWRNDAGTDSIIDSSVSIEDGEWHHIVSVGDGSMLYLYVDGEAEGTPVSMSGVQTIDSATIGRLTRNPTGAYFTGVIDEVRVYNRALSESEIKSLYNAGVVRLGLSRRLDDISGLVGWWSFDGDSISGTTVRDMSGNGNDGVLTDATTGNSDGDTPPSLAIGQAGQAGRFDGVDDYVRIADDSTLDFGTGDFSFVAWVKKDTNCDSFSGGEDIVVQRNATRPSVALFCNSTTNDAEFVVLDSSNTGSTASFSKDISDGEWHHLVGVKRGHGSAELVVYVDGVAGTPVATSFSGNFNYSASHPTSIGRMSGASFYYFDGLIDDVRIYNKALSSDEINRIYNATRPSEINTTRVPSGTLGQGLVGHWTFDGSDISGTTVSDRSGNGNDGTIQGAPQPVIGTIGQAYTFDGEDDYVAIGDDDTLDYGTGDFSVALWVKMDTDCDSADSSEAFWAQRHTSRPTVAITCSASVGNRPRLEIRDSLDQGGPTSYFPIDLNDGEWHHLVAIKAGHSSATTLMIVDGVAGTPQGRSFTGDFNFSGTPMTIGRFNTGSGYYTDASIDDVRVYNRALSLDEVKQLYLLGK